MQGSPACQHREADRHERAGGGQAETSIEHLLHKGFTICYQRLLPQISKKSPFRNSYKNE